MAQCKALTGSAVKWLKVILLFVCGQDGTGQWLSMDSEIIMKNGEPIGTQGPTGHYVLLDAHFELPSGTSSDMYEAFCT